MPGAVPMEMAKFYPWVSRVLWLWLSYKHIRFLLTVRQYLTISNVNPYFFQYVCDLIHTIEDIAKTLQPAFKAKMHLHLPIDGIRLLKDGLDIANVFNNNSLTQKVFPNHLIFAGIEVFAPVVENIPALFKENRYYAMSVEDRHICCAQFLPVPGGLLFRLKVDGWKITSADVLAYLFTFLPNVTNFYKQGKVFIRIGLRSKSLVEEVAQLCDGSYLPCCDKKNVPVIEQIMIIEKQLPEIISKIWQNTGTPC